MSTDFRLHHEKLEVYQISIDFLAIAIEISKDIPRGYGEIKDQLKRASLSIPLNISEGYGKSKVDDQKRFYDFSKGSAHECGALLDVCKKLGFVEGEIYSKGKSQLYRIVCMLVKFKRAIN